MYKSFSPGHVNVKTDGFEETLVLAKKYGYGAISYSPGSLEAEGIDTYEALDLMGQYGMILSDFGLPVQITSRDAFIITASPGWKRLPGLRPNWAFTAAPLG